MSKEKRKETAIEIKMDEMAPVENMAEELTGMISADQDEQEEDGSYTVEYKENELEYPDDNVKDTTVHRMIFRFWKDWRQSENVPVCI